MLTDLIYLIIVVSLLTCFRVIIFSKLQDNCYTITIKNYLFFFFLTSADLMVNFQIDFIWKNYDFMILLRSIYIAYVGYSWALVF
jgi:hypothetical protein